jgi:hypothetical protein
MATDQVSHSYKTTGKFIVAHQLTENNFFLFDMSESDVSG